MRRQWGALRPHYENSEGNPHSYQVVPAKSELKIRVSTAGVRTGFPFISAIVMSLPAGVGDSQVGSHLTEPLGGTLVSPPQVTLRTLGNVRQGVGGRKGMPLRERWAKGQAS